MRSEDAILGRKVFVSQQQFLIDETRHKRKQACPVESIAHGRTFIIDDGPAAESHEYFD